jgi:polar amino acid transport system substrate-binding protein
MKYASVFCAVVASSAAFLAAAAPSDDARRELAPQGTLRVAIAVSTAPSAFRAVRDPVTGQPRGVTVDLANTLAKSLGVPLQLVPFDSPAALTNAANAGAWDVAFVPANVERAKVLDFTPPYYLYEAAFLVRSGSRLRTVAQVDSPGVRIGALATSTTLHNAWRELKKASVLPFGSEALLVEALRSGKVESVAMGRDSLKGIAAKVSGSRVLVGEFHAAGVAGAVPKNHPAALAYLREFIEEQKSSGEVQKALDAAGVSAGTIAPPVAAQ